MESRVMVEFSGQHAAFHPSMASVLGDIAASSCDLQPCAATLQGRLGEPIGRPNHSAKSWAPAALRAVPYSAFIDIYGQSLLAGSI
jgi:hypothetical protein